MTSTIQNLYNVSEDYFKQRRSNSTKIDMKINGDMSFSFIQLKHALKYGEGYQDFNFPALLFGDIDEERVKEENPSDITSAEINEKLAGLTLTHLTLSCSSIFFQSDLIECLDLCPNLVHLNLSFYHQSSYFDLETLSESILKLTQLRTLIICLHGFKIAQDRLLIFANQIIKLRNLLELGLDLEFEAGLSNIYGVQKEFLQHKRLNTLNINVANMQDNMYKINILGSPFHFRKIKRLVSKQLNFTEEYRYENSWEDNEIDMSDLFE